jgi:plastocyanin
MSMQPFSPRRVAAAGLLLAALALAGCGTSRQDSTAPRPDVDPAWVKQIRRDATKVSGGETVSTQNWDGWGNLKGHIVVDGTPQLVDKLGAADQDKNCSPFRLKGELRSEDLVVGRNNGLNNVALYLATKGVPAHESYAEAAKKVVELNNHGCRFEPHMQLLRTSQTLLVKNGDTFGHNTQYTSLSQPFNMNLPAGSTNSVQLTNEERQPSRYSCDVHKWMNGYLVLRASPYMAKTADDGTFEIKNLPAGGTLEIEVWHERATTGLPGELKDVQGTNRLTLDKPGRLTVVIPKGGTASFTLEVPASALGGS